jgi:Domain of unknown function (DUF4440)
MNRRQPHTVAFLIALIVASFSTSLTAQSIWKEQKNPNWKTATGAEQYTKLLWQAVRQKDWLAVESHIASNFVYVDASGTKDKGQYVEYLKNLTLSDHTLSDANVTASGIDSIVTYTLTLKHANAEAESLRVMAVWQQQKSGWVMIALSRTKI